MLHLVNLIDILTDPRSYKSSEKLPWCYSANDVVATPNDVSLTLNYICPSLNKVFISIYQDVPIAINFIANCIVQLVCESFNTIGTAFDVIDTPTYGVVCSLCYIQVSSEGIGVAFAVILFSDSSVVGSFELIGVSLHQISISFNLIQDSAHLILLSIYEV